MITQTRGQSFRRAPRAAFRFAVAMLTLAAAGCAELDIGTELTPGPARTNGPPAVAVAALPALRSVAQPDSINPSMTLAPEVFSTSGLTLWDGARTLQGIWIAHPEAPVAQRVQITNDETGARVDGAMFRRDPRLSGPRIMISSEAAERLGLTPGQGTPITIVALVHAAAGGVAESTVAETTVVLGRTDGPLPNPLPGPTEVVPAAIVAPAPAADITRQEDSAPEPPGTDQTGDDLPVASIPETAPMPGGSREFPPPDTTEAAGEITDGRHFIQAGMFSEPAAAALLIDQLRAAGLPADGIPLILGEQQLTRVVVGPYRSVAERDAALEILRGLGQTDAHPVRV